VVAVPLPAWDEAVLKQIGRQLARLAGPIATLMVKRGAACTTDVDTLYRVLDEQLADRAERAVLLNGRNRIQTDAATGLEPSQQTGPAQPDADAISVPGWDAAVLEQVERQLARIIGPVAKLMVRRAAAITTDVDELYRMLAGTLTERDLHAVLLYGWWNKTLEFRPREKGATSGPRADDQARATNPAAQSKPGASAIGSPGWDAAVLAQVERQLARLVGPVAEWMIKRSAAGTTDIDTLYCVLAGQLGQGQERVAFLAGRDRLLGVPPREIDETSASVANQATYSDHESFPDVNGDTDGETPPSSSTT
jgi:hypothetical protein